MKELKRLIQWNPDSEEKFLQKMVCLLLPGQENVGQRLSVI